MSTQINKAIIEAKYSNLNLKLGNQKNTSINFRSNAVCITQIETPSPSVMYSVYLQQIEKIITNCNGGTTTTTTVIN